MCKVNLNERRKVREKDENFIVNKIKGNSEDRMGSYRESSDEK